MPRYMPVAGKLRLECPRFSYSSGSAHDLASTTLIHLLNIIQAEAVTVFVLFLLANLALEEPGYDRAKVTVIWCPVPSFVGLRRGVSDSHFPALDRDEGGWSLSQEL